MSNKWFIVITAIVVIGLFALLGGLKKPTNSSTSPTVIAQSNAPLISKKFTTINGSTISLSSYKGKKIMVWLLATWCTSCQAGLATLAQNAKTLAANKVTVLILETYGDAGYSGPTMSQFVTDYEPIKPIPANFVFGNASQALSASYNSKNYPDIYYLINPSGIIQTIDQAPPATLNTILNFSRETS